MKSFFMTFSKLEPKQENEKETTAITTNNFQLIFTFFNIVIDDENRNNN